MNRYIAMDCETGGLSADCSLLTAYFLVLDSDMKTVLGELELKVKPNAGAPYNVTAEALTINKIDLAAHDKVAITESEAGKRLVEFLQAHYPDGRNKLIPIGQNVVFDEMFIWEHLLSKSNWQRFVSYRRLDTGTVAEFLRYTGHIPTDVKGSLISIASFLDVNFPNAHDAKADTLATVRVLRKMKRLIEGNNDRS
jgi:oligoribonuclease (3'-5' exoribonuclease)